MAFKRVITIELDDAPDRGRQTSVPKSPEAPGEQGFKVRELTAAPSEAETAETTSPKVGQASPKAPGRTFPDLVAEFMNDARVMATILMFAPFPFFAGKVQGVPDLLYPALTGALLNGVWFGVSWFRRTRQDKGGT